MSEALKKPLLIKGLTDTYTRSPLFTQTLADDRNLGGIFEAKRIGEEMGTAKTSLDPRI